MVLLIYAVAVRPDDDGGGYVGRARAHASEFRNCFDDRSAQVSKEYVIVSAGHYDLCAALGFDEEL